MNAETRKILEMLEAGKITAEDAEKLLSAIDSAQDMGTNEQNGKRNRWLRVRVFENDMENPKVKVNLPLGLMKILMKFGAKFSGKIPQSVQEKLQEKGVNIDFDSITSEQLEEIFSSLNEEGPLKLVEVDDENERVEVYFE